MHAIERSSTVKPSDLVKQKAREQAEADARERGEELPAEEKHWSEEIDVSKRVMGGSLSTMFHS